MKAAFKSISTQIFSFFLWTLHFLIYKLQRALFKSSQMKAGSIGQRHRASRVPKKLFFNVFHEGKCQPTAEGFNLHDLSSTSHVGNL